MGISALLKQAAGQVVPSLVLVRGSRSSRSVALTFDDGPHARNTPKILDVLAHSHAPATFFLQGSEITRTPELVESIATAGHTVGNHGFHHGHWRREPSAALLHDVTRNQDLIDRHAGRAQPRLYRPPFGEVSPWGAVRLLRSGYRIVFWSADSRDSFEQDHGAVLQNLRTVRGGDIVLVHDDCDHTVAALPQIIEDIRRRGLSLGTLADIR